MADRSYSENLDKMGSRRSSCAHMENTGENVSVYHYFGDAGLIQKKYSRQKEKRWGLNETTRGYV